MTEQIQIDFSRQAGKPASYQAESLTHEEQHILSLLRRGKEKANSVKFLASMIGASEVELREKVRHLIIEHNCLIASSSRGYFIPETSDEIFEATRSLRHRGIMILVRAAKLQKISLEDVFNQGKLEFKNGEAA